ncbi:oxidoreductase [Arthrobacter sp. MYb211]|uniref:Gfo/Idh/MocA family protein n=1 Tax=unclassified Arthrobacter TaxID=235627 RepID=UPI000CFC9A42|nr:MULTISPECIES: Gfo/Idh/MocA family oxidoreductase [unclassified Arthrobacter]PRA13416.1 oxidoreductase [Arthrobacter sp. MYb221]PRC10614.1 oxidoreductase [Arthrobacter sp. MYb211]
MDLKVGIVGFGLRASLHRYLQRPEEGSVVRIVCDTSERGREDARAALPEAEVTADLQVLLDAGLDAVLVLTPDFTHRDVVLRTLEAGIPTFVEKPLDITLERADEILAAAQRTGTRLYVGHNMRHMPVIWQMKQLIEQGAIGEVKAVWCRHFVGNGGDYYFKDWHAERQYSNSLLLQKGAHDIDVIHWLANGYSTQVSGVGSLAVYGQVEDRRNNADLRLRDWFSLENWPPSAQRGLNPKLDVEDLSMVQMKLDNGVLASYQQCHFTPDYWRNYTVIGSAGRLENFGDGPGDFIHVWNTRTTHGFAEPDLKVEIKGDDAGHGGADPNLIAEFLRFARDGGATETSPLAARAAVAVGDLGARSLRSSGQTLQIPGLEEGLVSYFEADQQAQNVN